jgi:uncharacterized repeat protein (TIGR04138 family)
MQKIGFSESVETIVEIDNRYDPDAYGFVRDALDFTLKLRKKNAKEETARHVSGQELLEGVRQFALRDFGPMTLTVFEYWGIGKTDDIGEIVFNLINVGIFGKNERDNIDDFKNGYDFREAFVKPFLPPDEAKRQIEKTDTQPIEKSR